ncbi:uncharacterized protein J3R85_012738 [Psidium guajava]|nr:uncharacterized protein J3R85_012738 [Psidium guajava]
MDNLFSDGITGPQLNTVLSLDLGHRTFRFSWHTPPRLIRAFKSGPHYATKPSPRKDFRLCKTTGKGSAGIAGALILILPSPHGNTGVNLKNSF